MRSAIHCLALATLFLAGCIMLDTKPVSAGERAGTRYVTLEPLTLYGAYGQYPEKTVTSYFLSSVSIANRYHTPIGTVPRGTEIEIVDLLDRSALGVPHSTIYRIRFRMDAVAGFSGDLVQVSESQLLEKSPDGSPELSRTFFRRIE